MKETFYRIYFIEGKKVKRVVYSDKRYPTSQEAAKKLKVKRPDSFIIKIEKIISQSK